MLGRLVLILIQLAVGWWALPVVARNVPKIGQLDIFIVALILAILVWTIGMLGSIILKEVSQPSSTTLTYALVGALIGAGLTLIPQVTNAIAAVLPGLKDQVYPLLGAVIGYALKP